MLRNPWAFAMSTLEAAIWFFLWVHGQKPMYGWMFLAWAVAAVITGALVINSTDTKEKP